MVTTDEFYDARDQRDSARAHLDELADHLGRLANTLRDPRGVRLTEKTVYMGPPQHHTIVDRDDLVSWDHLEAAVRAFTRADDTFRSIDANLTLDQRRQLRR
jgi:hypothetical protein